MPRKTLLYKYKHDVDEANSILPSGILGAARSQQMTSLGAEYRQTTCFALPSCTGRPLGLFFIRGPESGRQRRPDRGAQNMSTRVPPSAKSVNRRNRVLRAEFDQTGRHSLWDIRRICVHLATKHPMTSFVVIWQLCVPLWKKYEVLPLLSFCHQGQLEACLPILQTFGVAMASTWCACGCFCQMLKV